MFRARTASLAVLFVIPMVLVTPRTVDAQDRGKGRVVADAGISVTLSADARAGIRAYYADHGSTGAEALPPGMRNRLAKGKALPPGIAKRSAPPALVSRISVPAGYEVVEVGLDVLLVEAATQVVHDVLMDVIR